MKNKEVMKAIQNLKTEFSEEVKILKRTEAEIKVELNISISQLGNTEESVISRVDQVEDWTQDLKISRGIGPLKQRIFKKLKCMNEEWGIMGSRKRIYIKIVDRDKGEHQVNDHIFNKMVEENHPN